MSDSPYDPFKVPSATGDPAPSGPTTPAENSAPPDASPEPQFPPIGPLFPQSPIGSPGPIGPQSPIPQAGPPAPQGSIQPLSPLAPQAPVQGAPQNTYPSPGSAPGAFPAQGQLPAQGASSAQGSYLGQNPPYGAQPPKSNTNKIIGIVLGVGCAGALLVALLVVFVFYQIGKAAKTAEAVNRSSATVSNTTAGGSTADSSTSSSDGSSATMAGSNISGSGSSSSSSGNNVEWPQYTNSEFNYMVRFPGIPKPAAPIKSDSTGTEIKTMAYASPNGEDAYMVSGWKLSTNPDADIPSGTLEKAANGVANRGTLISTKDTEFVGIPAKELTLEKEMGGRPNSVTDLIFISKATVYQIMTIFPKGEDHSADLQRFRGAFQLTAS